ncbi:hypothetical protein GCM10027275_53410 [Rhabdobacter roseus]|nr:SdrD B-like domain-containing protein [Rhabdobacter roseus]
MLASFSGSWAQIDLSLHKNIDKAQPSLGDTVTYTVIVKNSGLVQATGVVVKDSLPVGGVEYISSNVLRGTGSFVPATKVWNAGTVAAGDSAILQIRAKVLAQGVFFNVAEIMEMDGEDQDSWPGDGELDQDDIASACFSVPIEWYLGDEFEVSPIAGYHSIQWLYNGVPIVDSVVVNGLTVAVVNADSSLTIKGPGSFSFTSLVGVSCPATGCCAIQVVPGPLGSIGDFVWGDTNGNGVQDPGELGIPGITVELQDEAMVAIRTVVTDANGKYLFDSLFSGEYYVRFIAPTGSTFSPTNQGGDPTKDSNAGESGTLGKTNVITIDVTKDESDTLRNNPHIDAGIVPIETPIFDLALHKKLSTGQASVVMPGDTVSFTLTVVNQGAVTATNILLSDSLPASLTLVDANWTAAGQIATMNAPLAGPLAPGDSLSVSILVRVDPSFTEGTLVNYAQIQDARDEEGDEIEDVDSTPGNGFNKGEDDDDSEPIQVVPTPIFDLALHKKLSSGQASVVMPGDTVSFTLTVVNQGAVTATNILLSDSLPASLTLVDANWTAAGQIATMNAPLAGPLAPGDSVSVSILVRVDPSFTEGTLVNYAQIQDARDEEGDEIEDVDSTPGNGFDKGEDDDDSEPIQVVPTPIFDLALNKKLSTGQASVVMPGDTVSFTLTVVNQGAVTATNILLSDSLPASLTLVDANWTAAGQIATMNASLAGPLAPGDSVSVSILVRVDPSFTEGTLVNYAQIKDARDEEGDEIEDVDSTPGNGFDKGEDDDDSEPVEVVPAPVRYGSIGDYVWRDLNDNGVQDIGEPGVPGVTVELQDSAMVAIRMTVTDADGKYLFDSLPSGKYFVKFYASTDESFVETNQGGDPTKDSNAGESGTPGKTNVITIDVAKAVSDTLRNNPHIDAGLKPLPQCPTILLTVSPDRTICVGDTVQLSGTTDVTGTTINWYAEAMSGDAFATTTSGQLLSLSPTMTTTYYLEGTLGESCVSPRLPITVVVNAKPATPSIAQNTINECPDVTADLTAVILPPLSTVGGAFEWHVGPSASSALVTDPTQVGNGTYYLFERSAADCYSSPAAITVNIESCDCQLALGVSVGADQEVCAGDSVLLTATLTGAATSVTWTTSGTGTFANLDSLKTIYFPSAADMIAGVITLTATTNDPDEQGLCLPKSDALILTINPAPTAPFNVACADSILCIGKSTKLIGFAPGSTIKWYTTATGGVAIGTTVSGGKLPISPTTTTTYYAEAVSEEGCVSERTPITVEVKTCYTDLAVVKTIITPGPYAPGQAIIYSVTAKNLGGVLAHDVIVTDVLPASLTYVSSIPAGEYNNATGIWTIGNMAATANRTLIINATIKANASGFITNTAIVSSPDNDPNQTSNDTSSVTIEVVSLADLMLAKKVSKVNPALGETITYTLEVTNKGPQTATNVEVTDLLPAGLEFVSSSNMTKTGNTLKGTFASIAKDETKTLSFLAKVISTGPVKNVAQISKSDQPDPNSTPGNGYDNGEDDEDEVTVQVGCPTIDPPVIACATTNVCAGATVKLTAVGCTNGIVKWSNGETGSSITLVATENVTFTAKCTKDSCESAVSNVINIKVNTPIKPVLASNVSSVCKGGSATLTAANCNGVIVWSTGETGSPLVVTPTESTIYTAYCKIGTCVSDTAAIAIDVTTPGPAPVITSGKNQICPGESVTLSAHECEGIVKWSNGEQGASITVSPSATTSYSAICVVGTCESERSQDYTITIVTPQAPVISASQTNVCPGTSVILSATGCTGEVLWSNGASGNSITVTPNTTRTFTATCKTATCESAASNTVTINVAAPTAPIISANKTVICSGDSVTLTAMGCANTVLWSNGMTGASIKVAPNATTNYTAKCKVGTCESVASNTVKIDVNTNGQAPIITSANTNICAGATTTLTSEGCAGTVMWSNGMTGASIQVSPVTNTTYTATCKIEGSCASGASNILNINVGVQDAPVIIASSTELCAGDSVTLIASGCAAENTQWSTGQTGLSITVAPVTTSTFTATCVTPSCESEPGQVTLTVNAPEAPSVLCATDSVCIGESASLVVEGCEGTTLWSTGETGIAILVTPTQTANYWAKCVVNGCASIERVFTVYVISPTKPTLVATKTQIQAGESVTITASGCEGDVEWSTGHLGASITVAPTQTKLYTAICRFNTCVSDTAKLTISVGECNAAAPVIAASAPTVCKGSDVTLTATGCVGEVLWSNGQTGASITVPLSSSTTFTATCSTNECTSVASNAVTVSVTQLPAPTIAASSKNICLGDSVTLTAMNCEGTLSWSNGATGASITVHPTATTSYSAVCKLGTCESAASVACEITVGVPPTPAIQASATSICFGQSTTLTATGCSGSSDVLWSNGLTGASITIAPSATTTFTAVCCTSVHCKSEPSNAVTVNVAPKITQPLTQNLVNTCPLLTVDLAAGVTSSPKTEGGTFVYRTGMAPDSPLVQDITAVGAGTYYVFEQTPGGCQSQPATIIVTITPCGDASPCAENPAVAVAGPGNTICAALSYQLSGAISGSATSAIWTTNGTGTFSNPTLLNALYYPSLDDMVKGMVTLTLTTNDPDGAGTCQAASDSLKLTIETIKFRPNISINGVAKTDSLPTYLNICAGDSVVLVATDTEDSLGHAYSYKWNGGSATSNNTFVVKESGTYYVGLINSNSCCSIRSGLVIVTVSEPVQKPIVTNKRNACPATTVDLASTVISAGGTLEYRVGPTLSSALVASPEAVGAGIYYVFARSEGGCYSAPAKVTITICDCDNDTTRAEVAIVKTADKPNVKVGEQITYTITVRNNGPDTATNVNVVDIMPAGLQLVEAVGFEVNGNVLQKVIPVLAANDSVVHTIVANVTAKGTIMNTALITNLDQRDSVLANNVSSVGVLVQKPVCCDSTGLGVALAVTNVTPDGDDYLVTYQVTLKNYGSAILTNVQVLDSLFKAFPSPAEFQVEGNVVVGPSSTLVPDPNFDGKDNRNLLLPASTLAANQTESFQFQVRVTPNGATGPFYNSVYGEGIMGETIVQDKSNNGFEPTPQENVPTPVRFDVQSSIGLAKQVGDPVEVQYGVFEVPYTIKVVNLGMTDLTNVQVVDDLSATFGNGAVIVPGSVTVTADEGFVVNDAYTGEGTSTNLLVESESTLPKGTTREIHLMVLVDVGFATTTEFFNIAVGTAKASETEMVSDTSTAGELPDPDNSLLPGKHSVPTPVSLASQGSAKIGAALWVKDLALQSDGTYNVTYQAIVKNYGSTPLTNVQLTNVLADVFNSETGATFKKVGTPIASDLSTLAINPDFDGVNDTDLLIASNSSLAAGVIDSVTFTINVTTDGRQTPYLNRVLAQAQAGDETVTDLSTNGLNPDVNGNGDPTEDTESEFTPIVIPEGDTVFIPEGFSPNGDGINDLFIIRNTGGQRVSLEVYNRWMTLVYKSEDYKNDWDGAPNSGVSTGAASRGLPDGTYFYVVTLENGRRYVRYMTIIR